MAATGRPPGYVADALAELLQCGLVALAALTLPPGAWVMPEKFEFDPRVGDGGHRG